MQARMPAGALASRQIPWRKIALFAGVPFYLLLAANSVASATRPGGFHLPLLAMLLALAPPALYFTLRYPLIFPLGIYAALIPFDAILSVTSGATAVRVLGIFAAIALVARGFVLGRFNLPRTSWYVWLAFMVWAGISILWTNDFNNSNRVYQILLQNFALLTVIMIYPLERREFRWLLVLIVFAGDCTALYGIKTFMSAGSGLAENRLTFSIGQYTVDPNFFATSFLLPLAIALGVALSSRRLYLQVGCWASVGCMMVGILLSGSRGGFVAVVIVFIYFAWRSRNRLRIAGLALLSVGLTALYPSVWYRFTHDAGSTAVTGSGRTYIWAVGLKALSNFWLFGSGIGSFGETYARSYLAVFQRDAQGWSRPAHNVVVSLSVELGIIGLGLFLWAWYLSVRQLREIPKSSDLYPMRLALESTLLGLFGMSLFLDPIWIKYVWLALAMPYPLLNLYRSRRNADRAPLRRGAERAPLRGG